jgi:guanylate kinase
MLFVISGPSGCGKSTLIRSALRTIDGVRFSVSHTTRPRRESEEEGRDYFFVSKKEFESLIRGGAFLEWAKVHGHYYGTSKKEIEQKTKDGDLLLDIDVQGARQLKARLKKAEYIFIVPPTFGDLKRRLEERGQNNPQSIFDRLRVAKEEIQSYPLFRYLIVNDRLERAAEELNAVILSGRCRLQIRKKVLEPILKSFKEG